MIHSSLKRAVAIALLAGASVGANAADKDLGFIFLETPTIFTGSVMPAGSFNDTFSFNLPDNEGSGYSVVNFPLDIPNVGTFHTVLSTMSLISDPDGIANNGDEKLLASAVLGGENTADHLSLTWGPTGGGPNHMELNITGITNGSLGGLYAGSIAAPVPEPETYTMLLAGLGLMGAIVRRRSMRKNS